MADRPPITLRGRLADVLVQVALTVLWTLGLAMAWTREPIIGASVVGAVVAVAVICLMTGLTIKPASGSPRQAWSRKRHALAALGPVLGCVALSMPISRSLVSGEWGDVVKFGGLGFGVAGVIIVAAWVYYGLKGRAPAPAKVGS